MLTSDRLTFLGDVYLPSVTDCRAVGGEDVVLNLEHAITSATAAYPGKIVLPCAENWLIESFGVPPLAVSLANNHAVDFGARGLADTICSLGARGIRHFGAGNSSDHFGNPLVVERAHVAVGLCAYVCPSTLPLEYRQPNSGVALLDRSAMAADIACAKAAGADKIVVIIHWGAEQVTLPKPGDVVLARSIIDLGADLVVGHHAHRIQFHEWYKGKYIFYGIGNAAFPSIQVPVASSSGTLDPGGKVHVSKLKPWNKRSMAVHYYPKTGEVSVTGLRYDGRRLSIAGAKRIPNRRSLVLDGRYEARFRRQYLRGKIENAFWSFLASPKVPKWMHLVMLNEVRRNTTFR